jgi:hypothetical protein
MTVSALNCFILLTDNLTIIGKVFRKVMNKLYSIFFFLVLLSVNHPLHAQQDSSSQSLYKIALTDGSELRGTIKSENSNEITFKTISGLCTNIPKRQIRSIEKLAGEVIFGRIRHTDPNRTRLFFAPTARSLQAGQGYFADYEIFFPMLAVGIADVLTLAGGMSLIPGAEQQALYFAPKVTPLHSDMFNLASGVLYVHIPDNESFNFGAAYGVATFESENAALTCGLGWGFAGDEFANEPIILLGGEFRASNSIKFISENWIPPNSDIVLFSFGVRFFGEQLAADLGLLTPLGVETEGFPFMPWIGFVYNFGIEK